ncbi:MAG TPA: LPS assembly lipoprotein LptE [Gammaproteobacteria bacterium]|nr:LPS assembly lipoprotein LptE [Gammaproteobacteria bacterium]
MFKILSLKLFHFIIMLSLLTGCGFHLRGAFSIPQSLQILQILPHQPYDIFQRALKQFLKSNHIKIIEQNIENTLAVTTLTILSQAFSERAIAYGSNGLPNRAVLELKISYQLTDPKGNPLGNNTLVTVERELMLNPNAILGTDNERSHLHTDLYRDAASQLVRQLSMISDHAKK